MVGSSFFKAEFNVSNSVLNSSLTSSGSMEFSDPNNIAKTQDERAELD